ncbi:Marvel domain-containing protein [Dioscorea alata]|uniref:Marvel domain-containing protein n=1 Tax=Dioscorea alata TaxID=55571 RepID=A0ACB7V2K9_DIOAL|nr:Marvel domain-containing protein [Dioscorea alata]
MASLPDPKPPSGAADLENPVTDPAEPSSADPAVTSVVRRWRREDLTEKAGLILRGLGTLFSVIAFVVMASNKHGDWQDFDKYEEYRYLVAISVLAFLYSAAQLGRQVHRFSSGKDLLSPRTSVFVDFGGDQIIAYLLISAASAAIPMTNRMRQGGDNLFTDASSAAISMAFFAFFALALSAMLSGYKLSKQTYI